MRLQILQYGLFFSLCTVMIISFIPSSEAIPVIKTHDDTFKIVKTSSIFFSPRADELLSDTISLVNIGDEAAYLSGEISKLQLASHSGISGAPNIIDMEERASKNAPKKFRVSPSFQTPIEPISELKEKKPHEITLSIPIRSDITSTYTGNIWLHGDNVEAFPIKIEVKIIHNQYEFLLFAIIGIITAMMFGVIETWSLLNKNKAKGSKKGKQNIDFKLLSTDTYWSLQINPLLKKKFNPTDSEELERKISLNNRASYMISRITLAGLAVGLSLPAALFGNEYFIGIPVIDVITAAGIGFITYRTQDFKKLYRGDKSQG